MEEFDFKRLIEKYQHGLLSGREKDLLDKTFTDIPYEEGVKYMSFHIDKDFYLVTSKKGYGQMFRGDF